jgi:hypothetical protein
MLRRMTRLDLLERDKFLKDFHLIGYQPDSRR